MEPCYCHEILSLRACLWHKLFCGVHLLQPISPILRTARGHEAMTGVQCVVLGPIKRQKYLYEFHADENHKVVWGDIWYCFRY